MADIKEVVTAAVEPVNKLIDAVSGAIGKAYEPRHIRKMADAEAYRIRALSEEIRNNSDLPIVFNGTETAIDISDFDALLKRTGSRLAYQEVQKQENIESIVDAAYEELDGKILSSDEEVSRDWMNRFINSAGDISSDEMQAIWSKVLAGEVIEPNSFSLQTLDCLKNLNSKDAALFSKVCPYVISQNMIINDDKILEKYGISYDELLYLDDCGLINSSGFISLTCVASKKPVVVFDFGAYVVTIKTKDESEVKVEISQHPLTRAGRELYKVARDENLLVNYINDVTECVQRKYPKCAVEIHRVVERQGANIKFKNAITVFGELN